MNTWARLWTLDPAVTFLNHGSFGACPAAVLEVQDEWRARLERQPVRFFIRELEALLDAARGELGQFLGADPDDLGFVTNATTGVNAVVRSLRFEAGDEILVTDHAYNACRNALDYAAQRSGARAVVVRLPFPVDPAQHAAMPGRYVESLLEKVTPRTRLALVDHVTSPTGLVMPVEKIVRELERRGVDTLVDGAHAPGMLPLDLQRLGAAYYTGNCHKWLCAPKGAAFLYVRRDRQDRVHPMTISHGANSPRKDRTHFRLEFDWLGTDDPTAWLCVPESIRFLGSLLPGGWPELMQRNRGLALEARRILCAALGVQAPCPDEMIGTLAAVPLCDGLSEAVATSSGTDPLQDALLERWGIEVPVFYWPAPPQRLVRVSAQIYNEPAQYENLAAALRELLGR
jgi:isopenicillin-N epimerase